MKRYLAISQVFPPQVGGSGQWLYDIYSQRPRGEVTVVTSHTDGGPAFDQAQEIDVVRLPLGWKTWGLANRHSRGVYCRTYQQLRRIVRAKDITAIHAARAVPEGVLAWLLSKRCGLPYLIYAHGEEYRYYQSSREVRWLARRVLRSAGLIVANSHNTAQLLRDEWSVDSKRIQILHPGVDTQLYRPAPRNVEVRNRLGWSDRRVILTVGRLQKRKGQEQIIRALPEIRKAVPDVLYAIVGDGDDRQTLSRVVDELQLNDHVRLHGQFSSTQLVEAHQQCDVFALANLNYQGDFEGFGIVLLEAQACGKPVVAGDSGGTAETLDADVTGRIVSSDQPEALVATLTELLLNGEFRARMGDAAREWVIANFDYLKQAEQASRIFDSLAPRTRDRSAARSVVTPVN